MCWYVKDSNAGVEGISYMLQCFDDFMNMHDTRRYASRRYMDEYWSTLSTQDQFIHYMQNSAFYTFPYCAYHHKHHHTRHTLIHDKIEIYSVLSRLKTYKLIPSKPAPKPIWSTPATFRKWFKWAEIHRDKKTHALTSTNCKSTMGLMMHFNFMHTFSERKPHYHLLNVYSALQYWFRSTDFETIAIV